LPESKFKGGFEPLVAKQLQRLKANAKYEAHRISYKIDSYYTPDFTLPNGVLLEVKGYLRPQDRRKMRAVKDCNPGIDIRFVFQKANKPISKGSKTTYADWCDKYGFMYCEGPEVPEEWLK
jgi:hypothetical protein